MTQTEYLLMLKETGTLTELYKHGVVSDKWMKILEARLKVDSLMRAGASKGQAVRTTASLIGLSPRMVYNYLRI